MIKITKKGLLTTVQDQGRYGFGKFGVPVSGAMDMFSFRLGNILVGNDANCACLECTILGPELLFLNDHVFAITGTKFNPMLNHATIPQNRAICAKAGDLLTVGTAQEGVRAYLAFSGGVDVPLIMGSRSTYLKGKFGGYEGRCLQNGDIIAIVEHPEIPNLPYRFVKDGFGVDDKKEVLRVVLGAQSDYFSPEGIEVFFTSNYTVLPENDRMGYRINGPIPQFKPNKNSNIISDGVGMGSIQVSDKLLILMADRQTTGGYTKIGSVISADLPYLAQKRSGDILRFKRVTIEEAEAAYLHKLRCLRDLENHLNYNTILGRRLFQCTINKMAYQIDVSEIE